MNVSHRAQKKNQHKGQYLYLPSPIFCSPSHMSFLTSAPPVHRSPLQLSSTDHLFLPYSKLTSSSPIQSSPLLPSSKAHLFFPCPKLTFSSPVQSSPLLPPSKAHLFFPHCTAHLFLPIAQLTSSTPIHITSLHLPTTAHLLSPCTQVYSALLPTVHFRIPLPSTTQFCCTWGLKI